MFQRHLLSIALAAYLVGTTHAADSLVDVAVAALEKSVHFFHGQVAVHGGYVYSYSDDLSKREGEDKAGDETVWVQPPGTPAVGLALLNAFERTKNPALLEAARDAGYCLVDGQLRSGGWAHLIDFSDSGRQKYEYRIDPERKKKGANWTTFDDDKTQSALTFLLQLDRTLKFADPKIHEAVQYSLVCVLKAQFPNGGWPQGYQEFPDPAKFPVKKASYPENWDREFPRADYRGHYTFNDDAIADTITMLLLASEILEEPKYREAALRAGDFIILAQMPEPQPAWAQQYDANMHPVWARRFEPPAISGGESQGVMRTLQRLYQVTGERRFLEPVPRAIAYLRKSQLPDGKLARFYELKSNKPLYFTRDYQLTYDASDVPTHYSFKVSSNLDAIEREQARLEKMTPDEVIEAQNRRRNRSNRVSAPPESQVKAIIAALDSRGAWVEDGRLRTYGSDDNTRRVIHSRTFITNIDLLSRYIAAKR